MVAPNMLQNPAVKRWLGGIEPAWTLLDQKSFEALRLSPLPPVGAIRLAADFSPEEIAKSAVVRNALILLHSAAVGPGLRLTATGNLSRSVVAKICDLFTWPGFVKEKAFPFHKVVNEPDFLPLFFVRHVVEAAGLVEQKKGYLKVTSSGREVLEDPGRRVLQALLFHVALWGIDLQYLARGLHSEWPRDFGVMLWSLSIAARDWQSSHRLTRMCTVPDRNVLESKWDSASFAMDSKILRPLMWFGLLEHRHDDNPRGDFEHSHFYRKTPLFDRFLSFKVTLEPTAGHRH